MTTKSVVVERLILAPPETVWREAGGDVQEPVAQLLRFGGGEFTVQQQELRPGDQVAGGQGQLQPGRVAVEAAGGEAADSGVLAAADAVLHRGMSAGTYFQEPGRAPSRGRGVGEEDLAAQALVGAELSGGPLGPVAPGGRTGRVLEATPFS
jgi:hypothetical protein